MPNVLSVARPITQETFYEIVTSEQSTVEYLQNFGIILLSKSCPRCDHSMNHATMFGLCWWKGAGPNSEPNEIRYLSVDRRDGVGATKAENRKTLPRCRCPIVKISGGGLVEIENDAGSWKTQPGNLWGIFAISCEQSLIYYCIFRLYYMFLWQWQCFIWQLKFVILVLWQLKLNKTKNNKSKNEAHAKQYH